MRDSNSVQKRGTSRKFILTSLTLGAALAVTRPAVLTKVYAANQYDWTKLDDVDRMGGYYSSAARSADGNSLILAVEDGGESGSFEDWVESPLYISSNGGATWENVADEADPGMQHEWNAVDVSDDGQVMVAASDWAWDIEEENSVDGRVLVSEDGGDTWDEKTPADEEDWNDIAVSGDGSTIVATRWNSGDVFVSENGGDTWTNQTVDDVDEDIWNIKSVSLSDNGNKILIGGENSDGDDYTRLYLSTDGGDNWSDISPGSPEDDAIHGISHDMSADGTHIVASTMGWADGGNDAVYFSDNSGTGWEQVQPEDEDENPNYWAASAISDDGSRIAIVDDEEDGKMYTSGNDGSSWTEEVPGQDYEVEDLWWQEVDLNEDGSKVIAVSEDNAYISGILEAPTVTLDDAEGGKTVTITTPAGTTITCHSAVKESSLDAKDGGYSYPLGLVDFCFSTGDESNEVSLIFVTDLKPDEVIVRKYDPGTDKYTTVTEAVVTETTYESKHALQVTYTIVDNGPLDTDPDEGEIADPVGLALAVGTPDTGLGPKQADPSASAWIAGTTLAAGLAAAPIQRKVQSRASKK